MNHSDVQTRMADYLDGELALDTRAVFDAHLDGCSSCARELSELQQTISLLRSLPAPQTPPDLAENVIARVRAGEGRSAWQDFSDRVAAWLTPPRLVVPATVLAAAAGVFVVSGGQLAGLDETSAAEPQVIARARPAEVEASPKQATPAPVPRASAALLAKKQSLRRERVSTPVAPQPEPLLAHAQPSRPVVTSSGTFQPSAFGGADTVAVSGAVGAGVQPAQGLTSAPQARTGESVGRERLLRMRLEQLQRSPGQFASWLGSRSRAERDLWLTQFARFSSQLGIGEAVLRSLRGSQDPRLELAAIQFESVLDDSGEVAPLR